MAGSALLALAATWPLALHLRSVIAAETIDPMLQAWQVAWNGHALLHQPLDWFQANAFYPLPNSLAFSDALIGYTPAGLIGHGPAAAAARYNLLFIGTYALAFAGAYLLARELGLGRAAAVVSGMAFAFAPWRIAQWPHLHVLSSGGIPLTLFLLLRGYRQERPWLVLAGCLVAAWQVSLGFSLGLQLVYLLATLVAACTWLVARGRLARPSPRMLRATGLGLFGLLLFTAVLARPYFSVLHDFPEAHRALADVHALSPPPIGLLSAPGDDLVWGGLTAPVRDTLNWPFEQSLWPGAVIFVLALLGGFGAVLERRVRIAIGVSIAVTVIFAFGLRLFGDWSPYRLLYEFAPGWNGVRTPGRIFTLTTLGLALLAGAGAAGVARSLRGRRIAAAAPLVLAMAILLEGYGALPGRALPPPVRAAAPAPRLYLPSADSIDSLYMFWSTDGFPEIVNGLSGFTPRVTDALRSMAMGFPDAASVRTLRGLGVRSVIVTPYVSGTAAEAVLRRPIAGLGISRRRSGESTVFLLSPRG